MQIDIDHHFPSYIERFFVLSNAILDTEISSVASTVASLSTANVSLSAALSSAVDTADTAAAAELSTAVSTATA